MPERKEKTVFVRKTYKKQCIICGKEFETIAAAALTCGKQCRNERNRKIHEERRNQTHNNSDISSVLEKAREAGMSYGKYIAMAERTTK